MPRFSIRQLLIATAFVAVGIVALMNATPAVAAGAMGLIVIGLGAAVLLAIYRDCEQRAFWIGYAVFGWLYLLVCFAPMFGDAPLGWRRMLTGTAAEILHNRLFLRDRVQPQPPLGTTVDIFGPQPGTVVQYVDGPAHSVFLFVAHSLWTLIFATCGGWLAVLLYRTRPKPAS